MVCKNVDEEYEFKLKIIHDRTKPNGMPRKCLDISLAKKYGWEPKNDFSKGFKITFDDFINKKKNYEK